MKLTDLQRAEIENMLDVAIVIDLIKKDVFKAIPRPHKNDFIYESKCECCGSILKEDGEKLYQDEMKEYRIDCALKFELFKFACINNAGLEYGEKTSEKAFEMAWSRGKSAGLHEVCYELEELADLLHIK